MADLNRAGSLNAQGQALAASNDLDGAATAYLTALQSLSDEDLLAAIVNDNLATVRARQGNLTEAIRLGLLALHQLEHHPDRTLDIAITTSNLGLAYQLVGNFASARSYYTTAAQLHEQIGASTDDYIGTRLNIANLDGADDAAAGLRSIDAVLELCDQYERRTGRQSQFLPRTISLHAQRLVRVGRLDEAKPLLDGAIEYFSRVSGPTSDDAIGPRAARAELLRLQHDPLAEAELLAVLADQVRAGLSPESAENTRVSLAEVCFEQGRFVEQAQLLVANVGSEERRVALKLVEGSEDESLDAATYDVRRLGQFLSVVDTLHEAQPELVGAALEHWLRRKAMTRDVIRRFTRLGDSLGHSPEAKELVRLRAELDEDTRIASEQFVRPSSEWQERQERIKRNRVRADELERALGRGVALRGMAVLQTDVVGALPAALGAGTVLLEFCALAAHVTASDPATGDQEWDHGYAVFAVIGGADLPPSYRFVGTNAAIDLLVSQTLAEIGSGRVTRDISGAPERTGPQRFSSVVSDGLESLSAVLGELVPAGTERIVISADSSLGVLPFQILPHDQGQWIDAYEISYRVTAADLVEAERPDTVPGTALVLAAPQFSRHGRTDPFADLDGARQEGIEVAAALATAALLGADATKAAVLSAQRPRVLHLATHAFFEEAPGFQISLSTLDDAAPVRDDGVPMTVADLALADKGDLRRQLLRAGLALAGANDASHDQRRAGAADGDLDYGRLLALDIVRMDLSATELVVMSACDTGQGRAIIAQGLWGLPLALQAAGARCTVSSLWRVDDDSTRILMTNFYEALRGGQRVAAALRSASLAVRATHPEPRFWAPFVMIGSNERLTLPAAGPPA